MVGAPQTQPAAATPTNPAAANNAIVNNQNAAAGRSGALPTGDVAGAAGGQSKNGTGDLNQNGSGWPPDKEITDLVTLELCKMEAAKITGDNSIFVTCFLKYVANGNKITAKDCGCVDKTTATTTTAAADGTAKTTTATTTTNPTDTSAPATGTSTSGTTTSGSTTATTTK